MNAIKIFAIVTSIVFLSPVAMAHSGASNGGYLNQSNSTLIYTKATQNKKESYLLGLDKLSALESSTVKELKKELNVIEWYSAVITNFHLDDGSYVTVQERMNSAGDIEYVSAVNVTYNYQERGSNNR